MFSSANQLGRAYQYMDMCCMPGKSDAATMFWWTLYLQHVCKTKSSDNPSSLLTSQKSVPLIVSWRSAASFFAAPGVWVGGVAEVVQSPFPCLGDSSLHSVQAFPHHDAIAWQQRTLRPWQRALLRSFFGSPTWILLQWSQVRSQYKSLFRVLRVGVMWRGTGWKNKD